MPSFWGSRTWSLPSRPPVPVPGPMVLSPSSCESGLWSPCCGHHSRAASRTPPGPRLGPQKMGCMVNPSLSSPTSLGPTAKCPCVGSAHGLACGRAGSFGGDLTPAWGIYKDLGLSPHADVGANVPVGIIRLSIDFSGPFWLPGREHLRELPGPEIFLCLSWGLPSCPCSALFLADT